VSNPYNYHLPSSLLIFLLDKVNDDADEVDEQDDPGVPGENPVPGVENPPDDADRSASVDPGDDADDGAVDGPPTSSYVDLAQTVGTYRVYYTFI